MYKCVVRGEYIDPAEMISIDSDGVEDMVRLRSEVTRIPIKENNTGLQQIMSKKEMKTNKIDSPNEADSVMMSLFKPIVKRVWKDINYSNVGIV